MVLPLKLYLTESQPWMQLDSSFHSLSTIFNSQRKLRSSGAKPTKGGQGGHLVELTQLNLANTEMRLKFSVNARLQIRYRTQVIHEKDF